MQLLLSPTTTQHRLARRGGACGGRAHGGTLSNPPGPLKIERTTAGRRNLAWDFNLQERSEIFSRWFTKKQENNQMLRVGRVTNEEISIELGP